MGNESEYFHDFFRNRTPALLRAAYLLTGDRHLAEEIEHRVHRIPELRERGVILTTSVY